MHCQKHAGFGLLESLIVSAFLSVLITTGYKLMSRYHKAQDLHYATAGRNAYFTRIFNLFNSMGYSIVGTSSGFFQNPGMTDVPCKNLKQCLINPKQCVNKEFTCSYTMSGGELLTGDESNELKITRDGSVCDQSCLSGEAIYKIIGKFKIDDQDTLNIWIEAKNITNKSFYQDIDSRNLEMIYQIKEISKKHWLCPDGELITSISNQGELRCEKISRHLPKKYDAQNTNIIENQQTITIKPNPNIDNIEQYEKEVYKTLSDLMKRPLETRPKGCPENTILLGFGPDLSPLCGENVGIWMFNSSYHCAEQSSVGMISCNDIITSFKYEPCPPYPDGKICRKAGQFCHRLVNQGFNNHAAYALLEGEFFDLDYAVEKTTPYDRLLVGMTCNRRDELKYQPNFVYGYVPDPDDPEGKRTIWSVISTYYTPYYEVGPVTMSNPIYRDIVNTTWRPYNDFFKVSHRLYKLMNFRIMKCTPLLMK